MGKLLLHSLTFYSDLLRHLTAVPPNPDIVEVGSETGEMSEQLAEQASSRGGRLYVVEPAPAPRLRGLASTRGNVEIIEDLSPAALGKLPTAGTYVLDGDHNYSVVSGELREILGRADSTDSVVVMHDVGWPCARRDMYYSPASLPPGEVHDHSIRRGAVLDQSRIDGPRSRIPRRGRVRLRPP